MRTFLSTGPGSGPRLLSLLSSVRAGLPAGCLLLATALGCQPPAGPPVTLTRDDYSLRFTPATNELSLLRDGQPLLRFPTDAIQLGFVDQVQESFNYDPWPLLDDGTLFSYAAPAGLTWESIRSATVESSSETSLQLHLSYPSGEASLTVEQADSGRYRLRLQPESGASRVAYFRLRPQIDPQEALYGLGGYEDEVNHRGKRRAMQIEAMPDTESGYNDAHVPIPFAIGTTGWGFFVESRHPGAWDMASHSADRIDTLVGTGQDSGRGLQFHLFAARHPLDVTKKYYDVTGAPGLPARWALGPWLWRDDAVSQAQILADCQTMRDLDLADNGIWADRPFASGMSTFDFDKRTFADAPDMIQKVHDLGFAFALFHTPYMDDADPATATLSKEAHSGGYYPKQVGLLISKWGQPIDFTNPAAFDWWKSLVHRYTDLGVNGYKLDYGEDIVVGLPSFRNVWRLHDGSDERTAHATYKLEYHRVFRETLPEDGSFLLCRVGAYGDQKYGCVIWPGDMDANFARYGERARDRGGKEYTAIGGLPATVIYGLTLGPSGYPFYGADTGGYRHAPPTKEAFVRWFEQTALSSVMQVGTNTDNVPWETPPSTDFDGEVLTLYREYARLHLRLWPYEWTLATRIAGDGHPIQRPLGLAYPELGQHPNDVYLFGDDLLVAPVVDEGATQKRVVFPPGRWVNYFDGTSYSGPQTTMVAAPLAALPLYLREGGIVPLLRPTIDTLRPTTQPARVDSYATTPGVLYPRLVPGPTSSFTLFDGTELGQEAAPGRLTLRAKSGREFLSGALFEVLAFPSRPTSVREGTSPLPERASLSALEAEENGWFFDPIRHGTLYVKVAAGSHVVEILHP